MEKSYSKLDPPIGEQSKELLRELMLQWLVLSLGKTQETISNVHKCFHCGVPGHMQADCRHKGRVIKCFSCNSIGHKRKFCVANFARQNHHSQPPQHRHSPHQQLLNTAVSQFPTVVPRPLGSINFSSNPIGLSPPRPALLPSPLHF